MLNTEIDTIKLMTSPKNQNKEVFIWTLEENSRFDRQGTHFFDGWTMFPEAVK